MKTIRNHLNAPTSFRHMMSNTITAPTASMIATNAVATADIINVKNKLTGFNGLDAPIRCNPLTIVMRYGGPTKIAKGINIPWSWTAKPIPTSTVKTTHTKIRIVKSTSQASKLAGAVDSDIGVLDSDSGTAETA
ncbi:MAG: hypothetical protein ACK57V_10550 [Pirellula sp.]